MANPATLRHQGVKLTRIVAPATEPVTLDELKQAIKLPSGNAEDADLQTLLEAAREWVEAYTSRCLISQTWKQTQDQVAGRWYKLYRQPVISVVSISYISGWEIDTPVIFPASSYVAIGNRVACRSGWQAHRGFASWETVFRGGYYPLPESPQESDFIAARAAIPENIRRALFQLCGHFYENREGQGPVSKYEVSQKLSGNLPPNVITLLEPYIDRSFS